jgi:hypothetical protein
MTRQELCANRDDNSAIQLIRHPENSGAVLISDFADQCQTEYFMRRRTGSPDAHQDANYDSR